MSLQGRYRDFHFTDKENEIQRWKGHAQDDRTFVWQNRGLEVTL